MAVSSAGSTRGRDISRIPRLTTPLVDIAVGLNCAALRNKRAVINRANECNVRCILPGYQMDETIAARESCRRFSNDGLLFTAGVHPNAVPGSMKQVKDGQLVLSKDAETRQLEQVLQEVREMVTSRDCVAIGETGLDYKRNPQTWRTQKKWCADQVRLACELKMPLFMHEREAFEDLDKLLRGVKGEFGELPPIVIHCFTGKRWEAEAYIRAGFYIGITGFLVMDQRGRELRGFVGEVIPLDKLLLETDCPYMGFGAADERCVDFERDNEPCTLPVLAATLAQLYGESVERIAMMTTLNAQRFYGRDFGVRQKIPAAPQVLSQPSAFSVIMSQGQAGAPAASSTLSDNEKDLLKLARKFREIVKLEEKLAGGATLPANQEEKVARKPEVAAELLTAMELISPTSDVIEKISDVTSELGRASYGLACSQPVAEASAVDVLPENTQRATPATGSAADVQVGGQRTMQASVEAAPAPDASEQRERRWRARGGRSGFDRRYAADHS